MPKARWEPDLSKPLREVRAEIGAAFERALEDRSNTVRSGPARLWAAADHSLSAGGKRVRPLLVVLAGHATSPCRATGDRLLCIAMAVEMVHTYSLIHDDLPCMDDDALRRGAPTCHMAYGVPDATWAGALLLIGAFQWLAQGFPDGTHLSAAGRILADGAGFTGMVGGQWLDTELSASGVPAARFEDVHTHKTGALIAACCCLGALAGGADDGEVHALRVYGVNLGRAFQAVDDLLDAVGDEDVMGKKAGKDATAGKLTAPRALTIEGTRRYVQHLTGCAASSLGSLAGPSVPLLRELAYELSRRTE